MCPAPSSRVYRHPNSAYIGLEVQNVRAGNGVLPCRRNSHVLAALSTEVKNYGATPVIKACIAALRTDTP